MRWYNIIVEYSKYLNEFVLDHFISSTQASIGSYQILYCFIQNRFDTTNQTLPSTSATNHLFRLGQLPWTDQPPPITIVLNTSNFFPSSAPPWGDSQWLSDYARHVNQSHLDWLRFVQIFGVYDTWFTYAQIEHESFISHLIITHLFFIITLNMSCASNMLSKDM
jgi:hypothetical protein